MQLFWLIYFIPVLAIAALILWRRLDRLHETSAWKFLAAQSSAKSERFELSLIQGLPEPVQQYFSYMINPGTPLCSTVDIEMTGKLGLGSKEDPNYQVMQAHQILSPPHGLVWKLKSGALSGSDGALPDRSWTRFWLFGLIPIVRASGSDHQRSAFGRVVAEAVIWAPASLLPSKFVCWESANNHTARATVRHGNFTQSVDITLDEFGVPRKVSMLRWSNENKDKIFCEQPFGGILSDFRDYDGYRLPSHVEGGNHFDTPSYFPFFKADVTKLSFPTRNQNKISQTAN